MATEHTIAARVRGRYLVEPPALANKSTASVGEPGATDTPRPLPLLVGFHGYGETAPRMLDQLRAIGGSSWLLVSVQALNRFYTRGNEVVANWMTREDRELAIEDNISYVASVVTEVKREHDVRAPLVYVGFSQGVAMAYRAAAFAGHACDGLVLLAGDVPPDVAAKASDLPPILLGRGTHEQWYTEAKAAADIKLLQDAGVHVTEHVFDAGHVWDESFSERARSFLGQLNE